MNEILKLMYTDEYNRWIHRPGADKLLEWLDSTDFYSAPASTRFHLAREGGLVEHSVHVYERLRTLFVREFTNGVLPTPEQDESIAICGLLHDVCKANVYQQEPKNRKTYDPDKVAAAEPWQVKHDALGEFVWETVMGYRFEDNLPYGHGEKSVYIFFKLYEAESRGGYGDPVAYGIFGQRLQGRWVHGRECLREISSGAPDTHS